MTHPVIRPLRAGEEHLFLSLPDPGLLGMAYAGRDFRATLAARQYRPEWTWVALRGDRVVARAAWWAGPDDTEPRTLDWFDIAEGEPADTGAQLLRTAKISADYCLVLPPAWRERPEVRAAAEHRLAAARLAGMTPFVERLRYTWTPDQGLPERPGRLEFRPAPDDEGMLPILRAIHEGTHDAHTLRDIARLGPEAAVHEDLAVLKRYPAPRSWWRTAHTPGGELVGLALPSRNHTGPVVGFIGVVATQRGHGYGYDLLVETTHQLVERGADRIIAETDRTNPAMAAAFTRAGYPITEERVFWE
ncbi:GNAT family N-acetyltransferase [Allonocardiopsis opalescens]|uniref:Acetyltransferase (GNAT) family protein n=1 Tax=Allonocardiopsis opalescens TaxID=1144618 RepID=A0A2T0Q5M9_9ACTN|nr:GNAT family N-acetyltransferase [Allonocardiopsis opalescens]PRX99096.1 acetyltransferase (GNAT) family protein [Allonocardiopsis opalescens]